MPISPQDFELYSRMTGRSLPRDPAERMRMAPEVYDFTRNFGREPNVLQKAGNLVGAIGKDIGGTLLSGIGYGVQRSNQLADTQQQQEFELEKERIRAGARESKAEDMLRNFAEKERIKKENKMEMNEQITELNKDLAKTKGEENRATIRTRQNREKDMQNVTDGSLDTDFEFVGYDPSSANIESQDFDSPGEVFDQENIPNQSGSGIIGRITEQGANIADSKTVSESLTDDQTPKSVSLPDQEIVTGKGFTPRNYAENKGLIPKVETDLGDHPDIAPGENDSGVPNFAPTQDAVNKMAVDKAVGMGDQFMGNYGDKSPNEAEGQVTAYKDSLLGAIRDGIPKAEQDAARQRLKEKTLRKRGEKGTTGGLFGSDIGMDDPKVQENYRQLKRNAATLDDKVIQGLALTKAAEDYQQKRQNEGVEGALGSIDIVGAPSVNDKADDFMSKYEPKNMVTYDREGQMSGKAVNIELNPTPQVGPIADGAGYARLMQGDPTAAFNVKGQGEIDGMKVEGVTKYTYPATSEIMSSMADTEGEDSLGRKKFNQLFTMAQKGEGGFGQKISQEFFPRII